MTAAKVDLYIEQGATFRRTWRWSERLEDGTAGSPIDLTGWMARMQIRRTQGSPAVISLSTFAISPAVPGITLGGALGTISVHMTDDQTDLLTPKTALYDLELESPSGDVHRFLQGKITVDPNITQESDDPALEG